VDTNSIKPLLSSALLLPPQELEVEEPLPLQHQKLKTRKKRQRRMLIWEDFSVMMMNTDELTLSN
jgi:hypothetical protein